ncbi:MAG: two-component system sensor kinase [Solirubrobacterales bacterium]|nr:two-component system sensor kinase [Solirubrobacterales bacterium]
MRRALFPLIALLSVAGYLVTSETIGNDRRSAAERRAEIESVRAAALLDRARAYVVGLGTILAEEPVAGQRRFALLVGSTAGSAGLVDALWVQRVPAAGRRSYERRLGAPITRQAGSGEFERAPPAASYLVASYTTTTRPELRPGVDVARWPALAAAIRNLATVFAVTVSGRASLGTVSGFYLLESSSFGRGRDSGGYLAVFVPRGWLTLSLGDDPREVGISLDGRSLEGQLRSAPAAAASFEGLARSWRVAVVAGPASGLQSLLPWFALGWPIAAALVAFLVGNGVVRRRRAERETERIFDLSLDMLGIIGLDGYYKRVNPAFERILGYSGEQLLERPLFDFIHPDDVERSRQALESLSRGHQVVQFENRYIRSDGSLSWLEWNVRPALEEGVVYAAGRDVTDRRRAEEEQAALRRVATLVARGAPPENVFAAVSGEVLRLFPVDFVAISRYESSGTMTTLATSGRLGDRLPVGSRRSLGGRNVSTIVFETGRPARIDSYADASGAVGVDARERGFRSSVGAPIVVDGRLWGVISASARQEQRLPADTDARLASFTGLVATAISNTEARTEVAASRARIVAATDEERRRVVRDLHDGAQQRLVHTVITLQLAQRALRKEREEDLRALLSEALDHAQQATGELRELAHGILPAVLTQGGLRAGVDALASRAPVPVEIDVSVGRLPAALEATAYFVVAEALTNVAKHARAERATVTARLEDGTFRVQVRDNGIGGARPDGSGLLGLADRLAALDGELRVESPADGGTLVAAAIPLRG